MGGGDCSIREMWSAAHMSVRLCWFIALFMPSKNKNVCSSRSRKEIFRKSVLSGFYMKGVYFSDRSILQHFESPFALSSTERMESPQYRLRLLPFSSTSNLTSSHFVNASICTSSLYAHVCRPPLSQNQRTSQ